MGLLDHALGLNKITHVTNYLLFPGIVKIEVRMCSPVTLREEAIDTQESRSLAEFPDNSM